MKKSLSVLLAVVLTLSLFPAFGGANASQPFAIIFTNDVHGYYAASDGVFGHDYIASVIDDSKKTTPATFVLDAGDATQGILFANKSKGHSAIDVMNAVGYDAMVLGNHEFDFGFENTKALRKTARFPFLTQPSVSQGIEGFPAYIVIERGGVKLGVFGITTPNSKRSSYGGFNIDFGTADDIIQTAKDGVAALQKEKVDFIVCLAHMGVDDTGEGTSYAIRDSVDGIDLIIDGHSHTALADIEQAAGKSPIVSTGEYAGSIGIAEVADGVVRYKTCKRSDFASLAPKASVTEVISKYQSEIDKLSAAVIGISPVAAKYVREEMRTSETVLGDIVTDGIRSAAGTDIAFMNSGSIRAALEQGDVTFADAYAVLPYLNFTLAANVKGSVVREALEQSVRDYPNPAGGFLQVSGLNFSFDPDKPAGGRVTEVTVGGAPLDDGKNYSLAVNDWLANGGDGYSMLVKPFMTTIQMKEPNLSSLTDIFVWYLGAMSSAPNAGERIKTAAVPPETL
jgi:5'-nucleotidase